MSEPRPRRPLDPLLSRRGLLCGGARAFGALGLALLGGGAAAPVARGAGGRRLGPLRAPDANGLRLGPLRAPDANGLRLGPLRAPDANGLRLPAGFRSRVVARSGRPVPGTAHVWHAAPDGGATFASSDGGWVYVSNSELGTGGGAGAIRFAADGSIVDAYPILSGTHRNCAGGPTPWGTWLSCEEVPAGSVWECDPQRSSQGVRVPALGTFNHEAAAVDPVHERVYLTEDRPDGRLYRFRPARYPSLAEGTLEVAEVLDPDGLGPVAAGQERPLAWHALAEANPAGGGIDSARHFPVEQRATRYQVPGSTPFSGGEGCFHRGGRVVFSTKGDDRVWQIDTATDRISILYDAAASSASRLRDVDNLYVAPNGDVYVSEDPGDLQIVALTASGPIEPIVQLTGVSGTELTGPALSPDGSRLYFSSQRNPGVTYEVSGPFLAAGTAGRSDAGVAPHRAGETRARGASS